jgi:hypothetical protein
MHSLHDSNLFLSIDASPRLGYQSGWKGAVLSWQVGRCRRAWQCRSCSRGRGRSQLHIYVVDQGAALRELEATGRRSKASQSMKQ